MFSGANALIPTVNTSNKHTPSSLVRYVLSEGRNPRRTDELRQARPGERSRAQVLEISGFGWGETNERAVDRFRKWLEWSGLPEHQLSRTRKTTRTTFHASLNWSPGEEPTHEQMREAARSFMQAQGLGNASYMVVAHDDKHYRHAHIVASRLEPATGRVLNDFRSKIKAQAWGLQYERDHSHIPETRRELHALADAVRNRDVAGVLHGLTERDAAFTRGKLDAALWYGGLGDQDWRGHIEFRNEILRSKELVPLHRTRTKPAEFTTRKVLAQERSILESVRDLAKPAGHDLHVMQLQPHERNLNDEQREALHRMTGPEGFSMVTGQAGTGKSRLMAAARDAYKGQGRDVVGLATTNQVANDLRKDGFEAATLDSELYRLREQQWKPGTVVMVDEAAQLSHEKYDRLMAKARESGAKVVLVGDDRQTPSVSRGGLFTQMAQEHGSAELKQVMRVKDPNERRVWRGMHRGTLEDYQEALDHFDREGGIHWHDKSRQAEAQMAIDYEAATRADPNKTRLMLSGTNAGVERLNTLGRQLAREHGQLGPDVTIPARDGPLTVAVGDRVRFTGNGATKAEKRRGFTNGYLGTVKALEVDGLGTPRMTVDLGPDRKGNERMVRFAVGPGSGQFNALTYGYATTSYSAQGKTLQDTYAIYDPSMKQGTSYVTSTRHREHLHLYVSRDVAQDREALARSMQRNDRKWAASAYQTDHTALRDRAELTATMDADRFARRQAERLLDQEPVPAEWRAAERRADALNRAGAPVPPSAPRPQTPSSEMQQAAPQAARRREDAPQDQATQRRPVVEPTPLAAKATQNQTLRRDTEQAAPIGNKLPPDNPEPKTAQKIRTPIAKPISVQQLREPKEPTQKPAKAPQPDSFPQSPPRHADAGHGNKSAAPDRALRDRDGAPLGGAAHPQGPVKRAQQRETLQGTERPQPRREAPQEPPRTQEPERPWALESFRRAAEAGNERRRAQLFSGQPHSGPEIRVQQPRDRERAWKRRYDDLTAALSGIYDRGRSRVSEWWNHRDRPEVTAHAHARRDERQGHQTPRTDPSPQRRATPAAEPVRERPQAAPQPAPQPRTEPPRAAPTPPRQESREAPARDMRPQIKEAIDRSFSPEPSHRSRDGPKR